MMRAIEQRKLARVFTAVSGYLEDALAGDLDAMIHQFRRQTDAVDFDTLIGTGLSGTLVIPALARATGRFFAIVRKECTPHTDNQIEGTIGERWVFVDDFIASGSTRSRVIQAVEKIADRESHRTEFVGSYLYAANDMSHVVSTEKDAYGYTYDVYAQGIFKSA